MTVPKFYTLIAVLFCVILFACKGDTSISHKPPDNNFKLAVRTDFISYVGDSAGFKRSLDYVDSSFSMIKDPGYKDYFLYYNLKGGFCFYMEDYVKSIRYNDSILMMADKHREAEGFTEEYAGALLKNGDCYTGLGDFSKAYKSYYQARKMIGRIKRYL